MSNTPIDVDVLAQEIRRVDGNHDKGAGALAEALMPFLSAALQSAADTPPSPYAHRLRLAVAAVLEADTEFRSNMPKDWEGDPLSDEIDALRRIFEADPAPETRGAPLPPSKVREE